jgi:hypothetical protein
MPSVTAQADVAHDWKGLLDSTEKSPDVLPSIENDRTILEGHLEDFQILKARQNELTALRQETTQELKEVVARGKEVAVSIRSVLRGKIGPWNERLVHYKIAPIRRRPRKPVEVVVEKPVIEVRTEPVVKVPPTTGPVA